MKEEGGLWRQERGSQRAPSCPSRLPGAQPCCSCAGIPVSHCGDNVPMPQAGPGGMWWGRGAGDGGAMRAALLRMGWCCESAAKQQP